MRFKIIVLRLLISMVRQLNGSPSFLRDERAIFDAQELLDDLRMEEKGT